MNVGATKGYPLMFGEVVLFGDVASVSFKPVVDFVVDGGVDGVVDGGVDGVVDGGVDGVAGSRESGCL